MAASRASAKRTWITLAAVLTALLAVFVIAVAASAAYTERSSFCVSACHEMQPYGRTWKASSHSGVACVRCHVRPGIVRLLETKLSALREVYVHVTGQVKAPIAVTRQIPDATCLSCHPARKIPDPIFLSATQSAAPTDSASATPAFATTPPANAAPRSAPPVGFSHAAHAKGVRCIDCHAQVVHRGLPGRPSDDPATMASCLRCHDGKRASIDCDTCHTAPHPARGRCVDCHTLGTWATRFTHPVPLGTSHRSVLCEQCHTQAKTVTEASGRPAADMGFPAGCVDCHKDHHHDAKALLCARCHVPGRYAPSTFDHPSTGCQDCHTAPHSDRGQCSRCHSQHSWTAHFVHPIVLAGVHASFPCSRCHTRGIGNPGLDCSTCHGSNHGGLTDCGRCHTTAGWSPSTFQHPATAMSNWASMVCSACHPSESYAQVYCSCHNGKPPGGN